MQFFKRYTREGPGVDPNAPEKKGIALFLEVVAQKFFKLLRLNLLYFVCSLPFFLIILLFITPMYTRIFISGTYGDDFISLIVDLFFSFVIFNFIGSGPVSAAYSYITGSFIKGSSVWIFEDGFDKFKENFKNGIFLYVTDIIALTLFAVAIGFYKNSATLPALYMFFFAVVLLIFYILSHTFAYQIMVNFECKFTMIIKNAFIFTIAKLPMCVILSAFGVILIYLLFNYLNIFAVFIYMTVGMLAVKLPLEFYTSRVIKKLIDEEQKEGF